MGCNSSAAPQSQEVVHVRELVMSPAHQARIRELEARNRELEAQNRELEALVHQASPTAGAAAAAAAPAAAAPAAGVGPEDGEEVPTANSGRAIAIEGDEAVSPARGICCWKVESPRATIALREGVAVQAEHLGLYQHGIVTRVNDDGTVDVDLNIDRKLEHLPPTKVRVNEAFERRNAETLEDWRRYRALRTDKERIAFCEDLGNTKVPPVDYEQATGRLALLIRMGAIRLLKGSWLIAREEKGFSIDRMQDMPPKAYWDAEELLQSWMRSKGRYQQPTTTGGGGLGPLSLVLVAISCCWCSPGHPDQNSYHLKRVKVLLEAFTKFRQQKGSPWKDVAVFWDFSSIFQSPRSPLEDALFDAAKGSMQLMYGHDLAFVWKLMAMPPCPQPLDEDGRFQAEVHGEPRLLAWSYHGRGWPSFESAIADARATVVGSRMAFEDEELCLQGYRDTFRFRSSGTAIHPDRFASMLATKTFVHGSDSDMVTQLYRDTFEVVKHAKGQNLQRVAWTEDRMAEYFEALAEMEDLEYFQLGHSPLGDDAALRFAEQLATKKPLRELLLTEVGLTDAGVGPVLACLPADLQQLVLSENPLAFEPTPQDLNLEFQMPANLKSLALQRNRITDGGAARLAGLLPASLVHLLLDNNAIGDSGAQALLTGIPAGLQTLELIGNRIALEALQDNTRLPEGLVQLSLRNNRISNRGAAWLAGRLPGCLFLAKLFLDDNLIEDAGAEALFASLPVGLQDLVLTGNRITLGGGAWSCLPTTSITQLFLENNAIGDAGAKVLLANLPGGLEVLDLRSNRIALEDMRGQAQLPEGLVEVRLGGNRVGDQGAAWLAEGLPAGFATLLLQDNQIGDAGTKALGDAFRERPAFKGLDLRGNGAITAAGRRALSAALPSVQVLF